MKTRLLLTTLLILLASLFSVSLYAQLSGNFTINGSGPGDFSSLSAAVSALSTQGVNGPVVFSIEPGVYTTQVVIPAITGASSTNTITFVGAQNVHDSVIYNNQFNSDNRHIIMLNGAKYVKFDNLTFTVGPTALFGYGFHIQNQSEHIEIKNSVFNNRVETTTNFIHILAAGGLSWDAGGNTVSNLLVSNNVFNDGYAGVRINGSATVIVPGIQIRDNVFNNIYHTAIHMVRVNAPIIDKNYINNRTELPIAVFGSGITLQQAMGATMISNNIIKNVGRYGIYSFHGEASPNNRAKIYNNSIGGGFLAPGAFTSGIRFGTGTYNWDVHYNSVNVDFGEGAAFLVDVTAYNLDIRNNSFAYTGGSAGYAFRMSNPSVIQALDNNNYYGNGTYLALYYNDVYCSNLAAMQAVNVPVGSNMNSREGNPNYSSTHNLVPVGPQLIGGGVPIAGMTEDILGNPRNSVNPCMGAYEIEIQDLPFLSVDPSESSFVATVGGASSPQSFTLYNMGGGNMVINAGGITLTGLNSDNFSLSNITYPLVIGPNASHQVSLTFVPLSEGNKEATLVIEHTGFNSPYSVPITGYAYPSGTLVFGSGTAVNPNFSGNPINIIYRSLRGQMVYHASDLYAAGIQPGSSMTHFGFYVFGAPSEPLPNFRIRMVHTSATDVSSHINATSNNNVYFRNFYMPVAGGWDVLTLDQPFVWNGVDNILVDTAFSQVDLYSNTGQTRIYPVNDGFRFIRGDELDCSDLITSLVSNYKPQAYMQFLPPANPGTITGTVSLAGGEGLITNVSISAAYANVNPDINGNYSINLIPGTYNLTASLPGYRSVTIENIVVESGIVIPSINFVLNSIEVAITPLAVTETVEFQSSTTIPLTISSLGYGSLEYSVDIVHYWNQDRTVNKPTMLPSTNTRLSGLLSDNTETVSASGSNAADINSLVPSRDLFDLLGYFTPQGGGEYGISTDGNFIYTTRWNSGLFLRYNLNGTFIGHFTIPGVSNIRDLTYDGQYFYGSPNSSIIYKLDLGNQTLVGQINTSMANIRSIAYDADEDMFWVASGVSGPFKLINRNGVTVRTVNSVANGITGISWDGSSENGPFIWAYTQPGGIGNVIEQISLTDGSIIQTFDLAALGIFGVSASGGLEITNQLIPGKWTFLGNAQNDVVWIAELCESEIHWLSVNSSSGVVPPGQSHILELSLNAAGLPAGTYNAELIINNNSLQELVTIPVVMIVEDGDPIISIVPMTHNFGQQQVGLISNLQVFSISNLGGSVVSFGPNDIQLVGTNPESFVLTNVDGQVNLGYNGSVNIGVRFAPNSSGTKSAILQINDHLDNPRNYPTNSGQGARTVHNLPLFGEGVYFLLPPENLVATEGNSIVELSWEAPFVPGNRAVNSKARSSESADSVSDENVRIVLEGYNVYRNNVQVNTGLITGTNYTDTSVVNDVTYQYYVTAVYDDGESLPSNIVEATPYTPLDFLLPPKNLTANLIESNVVELMWETPVFGDWIYWDRGVNEGNAIGTGGVVQFKAAQRFSPANLQSLEAGGRYLTKLRFFPMEANCVYTINVWTGGTSVAPGTLVVNQPVPNPVIGEWNIVDLEDPVYINDSLELWFGYDVMAQAGYPAGADNGPVVNGFGNMMFYNNQWSTLNVIAPGLDYNWNIHGYTANVAGRENSPIVHSALSNREEVILEKQDSVFSLDRSNAKNRTSQPRRDLETTGFRIYRDGIMLSEIAANQTTYTDAGLEQGLYQYYVTSLYGAQESIASNIVLVSNQLDVLFNDNFSSYPNFALQFSPWTLLDIDQSITQGFDDFSFANWGSPMAFMIFNPSATIPPMTTNTPYSGSKMAASFTAITPPNNDWMITPRVNLGTESAIRFYAKSHSSQHGLERIRVGVSTLANPTPESFQYLTGPTYVEVPTNWTEYMYDLTAYDGMNVRIGIQNVSSGAMVLYIDEVSILSIGGSVSNDVNTTPVIVTELKGNYPNPFNPETTIRYSVSESVPVRLDIYNVKGQLVKTLVNDVKASGNHTALWDGKDNNGASVSSGVYFYKMQAGKFNSTRKMILMK